MQKAASSLSVYRFLDAREFLKQAYLHEKRANPAFSQRYIAQVVKANSSSFFRQVLAGKSRLTRARVAALARLFRLSRAETAYFEDLVAYSEAGTEAEKRLVLEKLKAADPGGKHALLEASQMEYLSKWHYAAIRELFAIHDFRGDHAALGRLLVPEISEQEARNAVDLLLRLKLIRKNAQGGYDVTDRVVLSGPKASPDQVRPMLLGHLDLARRALDTFPAPVRPFSHATLSVSADTVRLIHERFLAFRREAFALATRDAAVDRLYQLNFQFFPLTGVVQRRKK
ncbi:MAG: hypothetical protein K0Q91_2036 [Fibrobacteria bacterium]|jgi:uncharacterized protein (TIGR02147 family)|nr:hypothetical protein [Fibrobacteria bacterium]